MAEMYIVFHDLLSKAKQSRSRWRPSCTAGGLGGWAIFDLLAYDGLKLDWLTDFLKQHNQKFLLLPISLKIRKPWEIEKKSK